MTGIKPIRVYHVDGNAECLEAMAQTLRRAGCEVTSRCSGLEAYGDIVTPEAINADVAIIDYSVRPDGFRVGEDNHLVTGLDLIGFLARNKSRTLKISTSTTDRNPQDNSELYLRKPLGPDSLIKAVTGLAELSRLRHCYSYEELYGGIRVLAKKVNGVPRFR
jgi:CheY-like chemotaxis protein